MRPVQLAKALNISSQLAGMILKGTRGVSRKHYPRLATLLEIDPAELFASPPAPVLKSDLSPDDAPPGRAAFRERQDHGGLGARPLLPNPQDSDREGRDAAFPGTASEAVAGGDPAIAAYLITVAKAINRHIWELNDLSSQIAQRQVATVSAASPSSGDRPRKHRR